VEHAVEHPPMVVRRAANRRLLRRQQGGKPPPLSIGQVSSAHVEGTTAPLALFDIRTCVMNFVYTAWFRNPALPPDDQDHEWPACFIIDAASASLAQAWGDHLAQGYARRGDEQFLSSAVELLEGSTLGDTGSLPRFAYGYDASDEEVGW
jgi:hypothetical protein